ncbi:MAG: hypothetical protein H6767_06130 [Candidatus Peribacteria bacterium]|nr:MAG: hypothetical protein H6767_06130 [Candidatus Peribacteria bacterium]
MNYEGCVYANRYKIHSRGTVYVIPEGYYEADGDCMYANVNPPFFEFKRIDFMNEEASLNHSKHVKIT